MNASNPEAVEEGQLDYDVDRADDRVLHERAGASAENTAGLGARRYFLFVNGFGAFVLAAVAVGARDAADLIEENNPEVFATAAHAPHAGKTTPGVAPILSHALPAAPFRRTASACGRPPSSRRTNTDRAGSGRTPSSRSAPSPGER